MLTDVSNTSCVTTADRSNINSRMNALFNVKCCRKWSEQFMGKGRIWICNWRKSGQQYHLSEYKILP